MLRLIDELHRLRGARQRGRQFFADQRAAADAAAQRFGIEPNAGGLAVQADRLQDDVDRHFVLRLGIGHGDDLGGQIDGLRGPDADV